MEIKTVIKVGEKGYLKKLDDSGDVCYTDKKLDAMRFNNLEQAFLHIYDATLYTSEEQHNITYECISVPENSPDNILYR